MLTRAEGRKQAKALERERAKALKLAARAKVRELAAAIKHARAERPGHVRRARAQCIAHRKLVAQRARARRKRLLEELRETTRQEKQAAKQRCAIGKTRARESALSSVQKAAHALHHERAYQRDLKRIEANNRASLRGIIKPTRAERRSESDGEVNANVPAELVPLWERVKRRIKGSTRQSRTEAFLHYAAEHPREVIEAQEGGIDATIRELERQQARASRLAKTRPSRYTRAELAAVPF